MVRGVSHTPGGAAQGVVDPVRFWSQLSSLPLRQRFVVALVALAMLAGTVVGTLLAASGSTSPARRHPASAVASRSVRSFHDLPQGPPPTVPYWHAGVLHAAGATIRTPLRQIVSAGGTVLAGGYSDASPSRWALVDGARLQPIPHDASANFPTMSTDGNLLVWEIVRAHVTTVTAWDVHSRRLLATRRITIEQACCSGPALIVFGADSHGRVFYGDGRSLTVWTPATGAAHPVRGYGRLPALLSQVGPQGPVFEGPERTILDMTAVYGHVYRRGVFHGSGPFPARTGCGRPTGHSSPMAPTRMRRSAPRAPVPAWSCTTPGPAIDAECRCRTGSENRWHGRPSAPCSSRVRSLPGSPTSPGATWSPEFASDRCATRIRTRGRSAIHSVCPLCAEGLRDEGLTTRVGPASPATRSVGA